MTQRKVRVRFAPSPTGALHIGGVRTALYNYLFAKQNGGDLILRIEDTDSQRFVPGAEAYIIEALTWLGIKFDEGVGFGGEYGPYRQSERRDIYKKYVDQLLEAGHAYIAFDTPEELEAKRKEIPNFQYDASTRMQMRNSLTLSEEEVKSLIEAGNQYVVRVKIEPDEDIHVNDLIRGEVIINSSILDDKVLYKSADQLPTYHLANIVDDHLMEVTHVIRGEEWLPSAPLHVLLYRYFGWEDTMPRFAHLALLLKPEGNGKLSGTVFFPTFFTRLFIIFCRSDEEEGAKIPQVLDKSGTVFHHGYDLLHVCRVGFHAVAFENRHKEGSSFLIVHSLDIMMVEPFSLFIIELGSALAATTQVKTMDQFIHAHHLLVIARIPS